MNLHIFSMGLKKVFLCDSNIWLFSIAPLQLVHGFFSVFLALFERAITIEKVIDKKNMDQLTIPIQIKWSKEVKSDNFMGSNSEKSKKCISWWFQ